VMRRIRRTEKMEE